MNPKSLRGLKDLTSKLANKPKLIDKLDELRIRYTEITAELENPDTYKDRKKAESLNTNSYGMTSCHTHDSYL